MHFLEVSPGDLFCDHRYMLTLLVLGALAGPGQGGAGTAVFFTDLPRKPPKLESRATTGAALLEDVFEDVFLPTAGFLEPAVGKLESWFRGGGPSHAPRTIAVVRNHEVAAGTASGNEASS